MTVTVIKRYLYRNTIIIKISAASRSSYGIHIRIRIYILIVYWRSISTQNIFTKARLSLRVNTAETNQIKIFFQELSIFLMTPSSVDLTLFFCFLFLFEHSFWTWKWDYQLSAFKSSNVDKKYQNVYIYIYIYIEISLNFSRVLDC